MIAKRRKITAELAPADVPAYNAFLSDVSQLLETARRSAARAVNTLLTATY